jgi:transcriptional regulator with XRE-family HTH domain
MDEGDLMLLVWLHRTLASGEATAIRESAGLSAASVGGAIGVDPTTPWRWENGHRQPRGEAALRYARLLKSLQRATAAAA